MASNAGAARAVESTRVQDPLECGLVAEALDNKPHACNELAAGQLRLAELKAFKQAAGLATPACFHMKVRPLRQVICSNTKCLPLPAIIATPHAQIALPHCDCRLEGIRGHEHRGFEALLLSMGATTQHHRVQIFERATSLRSR